MISPKIRFFSKYAKNSVIIIDEAHAASGGTPEEPSNTFLVLSDMIGRSSMTTYLSATYAKREINMPLYAIGTSMRESGLSDREMIRTFENGGNALKEAVSAELTRNGQLLRREKQIQGKSEYYYVYDGKDSIGTQQRLRMDRVAQLFFQINNFQKSIHEYIYEYKKSLPNIIDNGGELSGSKDEVERQRTIKALTFQMFNFFLLGLKIDQTTQYAIEKLKNGIKPVITIANTLESALKNMPKTYKTDKEDDRYKVGDTIKNDFNLYIAYLLFYTMHWKKMVEVVDDNGEKSVVAKTVCVFDDDHDLSYMIISNYGASYESLLNTILNTETGVSIAPIDEIKKRIKEEGYSIDEITGRQLQVEFSGDDYTTGVISKRNITDTTTLVRNFNENKVDALFINQSGAVGISMHARPVGTAEIVYPVVKTEVDIEGRTETIESGWPTSLENVNEVKKRAMIVTQMELDINKEVQKLGRINRTGQVYPPEFTYIISAIPSESRLTALMEKKLRSLSANVSSNQQQSSYLFESDDFFSETAISPFNEVLKILKPKYRAELQNIYLAPTDSPQKAVEHIKDFTKLLYFSNYELQFDFYDLFSKYLNAEIERLIREGLYVGKITKKDYKAETISKFPFYIGSENARTSFGRHSFIEKASVTEYKSKITDRDINAYITAKLTRPGTPMPIEYNSIDKYKKAAVSELKGYIDNNLSVTIKENGRLSDLIEQKTIQSKAKEEELTKYGKVKDAIEVERKLNEIDDKLRELKVKVADAMENNPADLVTLSSEMTNLKDEQAKLRTTLETFGDVREMKQEVRVIERDIKQLQKDITDLQDDISRNETNKNNYAELLNSLISKIDWIGKVFTYQTFVEEYDMVDEKGEVSNEVQKYKYTNGISQKVVCIGINFPAEAIIPSSVQFYFSSVTETFSETYSKLYPKINESDALKGKKSLFLITSDDVKYNDKIKVKDEQDRIIETTIWNDIAKKTYTGSTKNKWFVVGSVLKSFMLSKQNGLTGEILKFTMKNNIDRIGIEITDLVDPGNTGNSTYTKLNERYNDETLLQYLVYFDGNTNNVDNFITNYVYDYLLGRLYNLEKTKQFDTFNFDINYNTKFVYQISSSDVLVAIVITPGKFLLDAVIDTYNSIKNGNFKEDEKIELSDLLLQLDVSLVTTSMTYLNAFAVTLKSLNVDVNSSNLVLRKENPLFPDVIASKDFRRIDVRKGDFMRTLFPVNMELLSEIQIRNGLEYEHSVSMSYNEFLKLINQFETINQKPSFAIGSNFFNSQKHLYILEQFLDNVTDVKEKDGDIEFVPTEENSVEKEISSLIDNLVKLIA